MNILLGIALETEVKTYLINYEIQQVHLVSL